MNCNQCEQTFRQTACVTSPGVCGKDADVQSLQETLLYGLKGMAAYAHHARRLGKIDEQVSAFIEEALFATMTNVNFDLNTLLEMASNCGEMNLRVMELLDEGHVETFGKPSPDQGPGRHPGRAGHPDHRARPASISGTCSNKSKGTDIKVYTHGEMLPAHMYPKLRSIRTWPATTAAPGRNRSREFAAFPGPVVGHHQLRPDPARELRRPPLHHARPRPCRAVSG